ncbi:FMRFamide receptor [Biomphalaria pfeifferi]|uniref:FMRFamide receptor n=1 Tax=Biomphalaria pfeifferi TaxID=112525 RepID=A0AAD8F5F9_BIOPF|nr:FMRFamide receptor [Biomphalaria pfeifferi]
MNSMVSIDSKDVSDYTRHLFEFVNLSILTTIVSILGIVSNILNIAVFYKQGLKSAVNISFMALSITDLINVLLIEWVSISSYPVLLNNPDIGILSKDVGYLTSGIPHACMSRITSWITVYMTAERCLCIAIPFHVKRLITPSIAVLSIVAIYILTILPLIPEYLFFSLGLTNSTQFHRLKIGLVVNVKDIGLEGLTVFIYSVMMITSFIAVIFLTLILILQLNKMSKWRKNSQVITGQVESLKQKEKVAIRTVLVIACILIITFTPNFIMCGVTFIVPGFSINDSLSNIFVVSISFSYLLDAVNASVNAALYYVLNASYRTTMREMFRREKLARKRKRGWPRSPWCRDMEVDADGRDIGTVDDGSFFLENLQDCLGSGLGWNSITSRRQS